MSLSPTTAAAKGVGTPTTRLVGAIALVAMAWVVFAVAVTMLLVSVGAVAFWLSMKK